MPTNTQYLIPKVVPLSPEKPQIHWDDIRNFNNLCIHHLFETQVDRSPHAIAIISENQQITYQKLNQQANQLANHLRQLGVKPETQVCVYLERSLEMIISLLAILKAGGSYVPLDPAYPTERLTFIIQDTQSPIILTQEKYLQHLPTCKSQDAKTAAKIVCLDSEWQKIGQNSQENPRTEVTPDNLIYTIYTSGSTGRPKGVMIPHRGVNNELLWRQETFRLTPTDKVLQTISFSFDPSVFQIFWPLCFGAKLVLPRPEGHKDTKYLVELILSQKITVLALVPSILRVLLEEPHIENCRFLKHITCGGEALTKELVERFFHRLNLDDVLYNSYGPTETTIETTSWACQRHMDTVIAPIGRPIANAETYILDENLQMLPLGEPGELHIGGMGLARGYLNLPQLTKEKFIPHPFSRVPGARLYKTGDLARYLPDGNIEFLGRLDSQVKIRGFRIELAEIESVIHKYQNIRETVVIAREDLPGEKQLVAYIVPQESALINLDELRRFIKEKIPDYMIPSNFVILESLPLTPNGKINHRELPAPDLLHRRSEVSFMEPRNQIEQDLTEIWQNILGVQQISIRDNFFELGGNSLLGVKIFQQIQQVLGKTLPLSVLFESGTIEALAQIIAPEAEITTKQISPRGKSSITAASLVKIQPNGSKPPFFCIHGLGGEVLCFQKLALHLGNDQPFYGIQPLITDDQKPIYTKVEDMASQYIQAIQTVQSTGPYFIGGYSFGGIVAFEMARQLLARGEKVGNLIIIDTCIPGNNWRLSFWKRFFLHLQNIRTGGISYLQQKIVGWTQQGKYQIQHKYQQYFEALSDLPMDDKHLAMISANDQAVKTYSYGIYPGKITLIRTNDEHRLTSVGVRYTPHFGWGNLTTVGVDILYVPGSHVSLLENPHVKEVAAKLRECLT
jgi:amino acid adenylation domain-containing protein